MPKSKSADLPRPAVPCRSRQEIRKGRVLGLAVVLSATFLGQFDFFVVNVAGPTIRDSLHAGDTTLELIIGGYAFAYAAGLITAGRLGDLVGYRRMFIIGISLFGVASLLCGVSQTSTELVLARLMQGAAAAVMVPQVLAYITATIAPERRAGAIAWYGVAAGVGSICGQVLGGVLVVGPGDEGWRLIFLVNIPVVLIAVILACAVLPAPDPRRSVSFDPYGALGVTVTLAAVLVPVTLGPGEGWPAWSGICLAASLVPAIATVLAERRLSDRGRQPLVPGVLLRTRTFAAGLLAIAAFMLFFPSFMFILTLLLQDGLELSPLHAGLVFVPAGVAYSASALGARDLFGRFGVRAPLTGTAIIAAGLVGLTFTVWHGSDHASVAAVTLCAAVMSLGNGIVQPTLTTVALSDVTAGMAGSASGLIATVQQFASAAGVAAIGTVFFSVARHTTGPVGSVRAAATAGIIDLALVLAVAGSLAVVRRAHQVPVPAGACVPHSPVDDATSVAVKAPS
jgi:MFS family permease